MPSSWPGNVHQNPGTPAWAHEKVPAQKHPESPLPTGHPCQANQKRSAPIPAHRWLPQEKPGPPETIIQEATACQFQKKTPAEGMGSPPACTIHRPAQFTLKQLPEKKPVPENYLCCKTP